MFCIITFDIVHPSGVTKCNREIQRIWTGNWEYADSLFLHVTTRQCDYDRNYSVVDSNMGLLESTVVSALYSTASF